MKQNTKQQFLHLTISVWSSQGIIRRSTLILNLPLDLHVIKLISRNDHEPAYHGEAHVWQALASKIYRITTKCFLMTHRRFLFHILISLKSQPLNVCIKNRKTIRKLEIWRRAIPSIYFKRFLVSGHRHKRQYHYSSIFPSPASLYVPLHFFPSLFSPSLFRHYLLALVWNILFICFYRRKLQVVMVITDSLSPISFV